jgi:hypothetical protein
LENVAADLLYLFHQLCLVCFFDTQRTYLEAKKLRTSHI